VETLGTKDEKQAWVRAKPVMMKFDGILAKAEARLVEHPVRTELTEAKIKQISDTSMPASLMTTKNCVWTALATIGCSQTFTVSSPTPGSSSRARSS
jgi:hypothetical protein